MPIITTLTTKLPEEAVAGITVYFFDADGVTPVTPTSATWTLTDTVGNVINGRSAVAITGLSTSNLIVLFGDDLAIGGFGLKRQLLVDAVYNSSTLGSGRPFKAAINFEIENFVGVT